MRLGMLVVIIVIVINSSNENNGSNNKYVGTIGHNNGSNYSTIGLAAIVITTSHPHPDTFFSPVSQSVPRVASERSCPFVASTEEWQIV